MRFFWFSILVVFSATDACRRVPSIYHSRADKSPGDNGIHIKINGNPARYVPGQLYMMNLMAMNPLDENQRFKKLIITAEATNETDNFSPQRTGSFQLYRESLVRFNFECVNTLMELNNTDKTEVFFMWTAPPPGSGCVTFRAMILKDSFKWFADEGGLVNTICEQTEKDTMADEEDCCACDEAIYSLIFEGLWSSNTHPRDYPTLLWLTHFSDVIGASHERNFSFWGEGQIASEGFRSLAEWGSVRLMETELRAKSKYLRTIIKAAGLWYPSVNSNTTAKFKVDRRHNLISLASMFGPTPDWVVGINGFNLCMKNCTWQEKAVVDLYPYDAGTDNGITYMSPNSETSPREKIYRITTTYPEDPRAPFYDPTKSEMPPLARLYIKRERTIPRKCDESFLNAQVDISENSEDTSKAECEVTEYSDWSNCSVTCGKGLKMRTRKYRFPQKAAMFSCNRQLVSKEMCVADKPECPKGENQDEDLSIESPLPEDESGLCATSEWEDWSICSVSCGLGFEMRTRHFLNKMGRKKCLHIPTVEKQKCMRPACTGSPNKIETSDSKCPTTEWSEWSPCSTSCGKGIRVRTRLLLVEPSLQVECSSRIEMMQQHSCVGNLDCSINEEMAKVVCVMEKEIGKCQGQFTRWYFDHEKSTCLPFVYSGCRGNRNNFLTLEDCTQTCKTIKGISNRLTLDNSTANAIMSELPAKIDCVVTSFSNWSPCSATCGHGITQSFRSIKSQPQNGGKQCPTRLVKRRKCVGPPCT